jgi:hypothetical protein
MDREEGSDALNARIVNALLTTVNENQPDPASSRVAMFSGTDTTVEYEVRGASVRSQNHQLSRSGFGLTR